MGRRDEKKLSALGAADQRMHDLLARDPNSFKRSPSTIGLLAMSLLIVIGFVCLVGWMIRVSFQPHGWVGWLGVVLGWATVLVMAPRPSRVADDVDLQTPDDSPALFAYVEALAKAVGVAPPKLIGLAPITNAYVTSIGWRFRPLLVIGTPLWMVRKGTQLPGVLAHELGHLRHRDTLTGFVHYMAYRIVDQVIYLLTPDHDADDWAWLSSFLVGPLRAPFVGVRWLLDRLGAPSSRHTEYLADRRAAEALGTRELRRALFFDLAGLEAVANSAMLRGEPPLATLRNLPVPTDADVSATAAQSDRYVPDPDAGAATHPPTHLRISLLNTYEVEVPADDRLRALFSAADQELQAQLPALERAATDALRRAIHQ